MWVIAVCLTSGSSRRSARTNRLRNPRPGTRRRSLPVIRVLKNECDALAGTDTDAEHAVTGLTQMKLDGQRQDVPGTRGPEGMTDGHRTSIRIETFVGHLETVELDGQLAQDAERLGR